MEAEKVMQFFSKWRSEWVDFPVWPNQAMIKQHEKFNYKLRAKPTENENQTNERGSNNNIQRP